MTIEESTDPGQIGADDARAEAHEYANTTFGASEQQKLAMWAVEDGQMTREEANEALRADGLDPLADPRDPDATAGATDEAFAPPESPNDYQLPSFLENEGDPYTPELQALDQARRDWLHLAGFPKGIGESVAKHVADGVENFRSLDESSRQIQHNAELARVQRHFGDDAERMIGLAKQLVDEVEAKRPGLKSFLEETGAGNSSAVVIQFALQAERLSQRAKR